MVEEWNILYDGFIERKNGGRYEGDLIIDGVNLSPIEAVFFKQDEKNYMWLRRKQKLIYDYETNTYIKKEKEPRWECYLEKSIIDNTTTYVGKFVFFHFVYTIKGVWDAVLGNDKKRINLYVERCPMQQQTIINNINERRKQD